VKLLNHSAKSSAKGKRCPGKASKKEEKKRKRKKKEEKEDNGVPSRLQSASSS
jgi:hypothetical protein